MLKINKVAAVIFVIKTQNTKKNNLSIKDF